MDYYIDANLAYYHIAKCGGTSMQRWLMDCYSLGKMGVERERVRDDFRLESLRTKKSVLGDRFDDIKIIATIRNPYEHMVSFYFFLRDYIGKITAEGFDVKVPVCPELEIASQVDFAGWVQWCVDNFPSYFDFLNIDGAIPPNVKIVPLESVKESLGLYVNDQLKMGLDVNLIRTLNETGTGATYREHFTRPLFDLVNKYQGWVFQEGYYDKE